LSEKSIEQFQQACYPNNVAPFLNWLPFVLELFMFAGVVVLYWMVYLRMNFIYNTVVGKFFYKTCTLKLFTRWPYYRRDPFVTMVQWIVSRKKQPIKAHV